MQLFVTVITFSNLNPNGNRIIFKEGFSYKVTGQCVSY